MKTKLLIIVQALVLLSAISCARTYKAPILVEGCSNTVTVNYVVTPNVEKTTSVKAQISALEEMFGL